MCKWLLGSGLRNSIMRTGGKQDWAKREANRDAAAAEVSADSLVCSAAGRAFSHCPELRQKD